MAMMNDEKRIDAIRQIIEDKKDYSLIQKLEFYSEFENETAFGNYILVLLVLIEWSQWSETASTIFLKKVFNQKIYSQNYDDIKYGDFLINMVKKKAIAPYGGISRVLGRLIATIIYDKADNHTSNIKSIATRDSLLKTNEYFLVKYLSEDGVNINTIQNIMSIYYNCIKDIKPDTYHIIISEFASTTLKKNFEDNLIPYLHIFIRPFYISSSDNFPDSTHHVPEPFYEQIFGSYKAFMSLLVKRLHDDPMNNKLINQIKEFMVIYYENSKNGVKFVDINKAIDLSKELHILARIRD